MEPVTAPAVTGSLCFSHYFLVHNELAGSGGLPVGLSDCRSGNGTTFGLFDSFVTIPLDRLEEQLNTAASHSNGETLVAVWGGDGTIRSVARLTTKTGATILPCPGGTTTRQNCFCRSAPLPSSSNQGNDRRTT